MSRGSCCGTHTRRFKVWTHSIRFMICLCLVSDYYFGHGSPTFPSQLGSIFLNFWIWIGEMPSLLNLPLFSSLQCQRMSRAIFNIITVCDSQIMPIANLAMMILWIKRTKIEFTIFQFLLVFSEPFKVPANILAGCAKMGRLCFKRDIQTPWISEHSRIVAGSLGGPGCDESGQIPSVY